MKVVNDTPLTFGAIPAPYQGRHGMTAIVKGTFALTPGMPARLVDAKDQRLLSGDVRWDDDSPTASLHYPSDFAPFKPRADAMLVGSYHPPERHPVTAGGVGFRVGRMQKNLAVIGERHWIEGPLGIKQSEPRALTKLPLRWENGFGGPALSENPLGRGANPSAKGGQSPSAVAGTWLLPALEHPEAPLRHPKDRPAPACFAPIDESWPQRRSRVGTFDERWLEERWPWFPEDFDWGYFNAAPADQQIAGYLRGDEEIAFTGMHPKHELFEAQLPGLKPRCFVRRASSAASGSESVAEIPLVLDTLWLDADALELVLVWRGMIGVSTRRFDEIERALVVVEDLHAPHPLEEYTSEARWQTEPAKAQELAERAPPPEKEPPPPPPEEEGESEAETLATARKMLTEAGVAPEVLTKLESATTIAAMLAALDRELPLPPPDPAAQEAARKQQEEAARAFLAEHGHDPSLFDAQDEAEPEAATEALPKLTREQVAERATAKQSLADADLSGLDLSRLDFRGADLSRAKLDGAILEAANLDGADLTRASLRLAKAAHASFVGAVLEGIDAAGVDLAGAIFTGANLAKASLIWAVLTDAKLDGADLEGATLADVNLTRATLAGTSFANANMSRALLTRARGARAVFRRAALEGMDATSAELEAADFSGATLDGAKLDGAILREATLENARGAYASFAGADLTSLRAGLGAAFPGGNFRDVVGENANLSSAELAGADFTGASLGRAAFRAANLAEANFHLTRLEKADFSRARLHRARMTKANLFEALLPEADLDEADCRGSNFYGSEFFDAELVGARFEGSNLARTKLAMRRLGGRDLGGRDLGGRELRGKDPGRADLGGKGPGGGRELP